MIIYNSIEQDFQIIDYSASHSQLLLRSLKTRSRDYNIDIVIKGVFCLVIPSLIRGVKISVLDNQKTIDFLKTKYTSSTEYDRRIFLMEDRLGNNFFINALCFGVYHNKLDILESSIERYNQGNHGELQLWYVD